MTEEDWMLNYADEFGNGWLTVIHLEEVVRLASDLIRTNEDVFPW